MSNCICTITRRVHVALATARQNGVKIVLFLFFSSFFMRTSLRMTRKVVAGVSTLALLAGYATALPTAAAQFSDVPMDAWYYDYVMNLVDMGIVDGNPDGTFRPDNSLNRAEMAKIAVNVAMLTGVIADDDMSGAPTFNDVSADQWFASYVALAAKNKIFEGYRDAQGNLTGNFGPGNMVNRAEASKVLLLAAGVPEMLTPGAPFMDVASTDWFYAYVTSAYNWSILDGYKTSDGKLTGYFGPGDAVTRGQIAKIAVLAQDPVDRYTGEPLNGGNMNSNESNANTNGSTDSNMNTNSSVPTSNVSFEAAIARDANNNVFPAASTLATGTAFNTVTAINVTAGKDEDVKVNEISVMSRGFVSDSTINGVLIVDGSGMRHGNIVNFSSSKATVSFGGDPIIVKAGSTQQIKVQLNFGTPAGFTSGTVGVEVTGIKATGGSTGGMVNVSFLENKPLMGNIHSLVTGSNIGNVTFDDVTITAAVQEVDLGIKNKEVSKFKITQANSQEDITLTELIAFNNGNSSDTDIENIKLVDQNGTVLSEVKNTKNRYAMFDLSAKPYVIPKGTSRNLSILVDVINGSTRTIQFVVSNDYDMKIKGSTSQAFLLPTAGTSDTAFPIGDTANRNTLQIKEGVLTVSKATSSPSGEVSRGATEVVIGEFKVEAAGEDIEIQGGSINVQTTSLNGNNELKGTFKLVNGSGTTIHSINAVEATYDAMFDATTGNGVDVISRFNNYYTVKAGTTGVIKFVVDIADGATAGNTLLASLKDLNIKKISSNRTGTAATTTVTGNTMTITAANLTVSKNQAVGDTNIVKGATAQKIGSVNLTTTNAEGVSISSIVVNLNDNNGVTNLRLMKGGTMEQLGSTQSTPGLTSNSFGVSGLLSIDKSSSKTVDIYADIASSSTATSIQATIPAAGISATGLQSANTVSAPSVASSLQANPVVGSGTVTVAQSTATASSRVLSAGETADLFSFEIKATNSEDMRLERAKIAFPVSSASISTVELYDGATKIGGPLTITDGMVDFSGLNVVIAKNATKTFTVKGMLSSSSSFNSNDDMVGALNYFEVVGVSSGLRVSQLASNGLAFEAGAVTLGSQTVAAAATTQFKAGQLFYNDTDNLLARQNTAGITSGNAKNGANVTVEDGKVLLALPTQFSGTALAGQLIVNDAGALSFSAGGALAGTESALPMVATYTTGYNSANFMVGDVVAYDGPTIGVVTAVTATTLDVTSVAGGATASYAGARMTKLFSGTGEGKTHILQNVRPVIAAQTVNFTPTATAEVAKVNVTASGNETLNLNSLVFSIAGSYNGTLGNFKLYQVQGNNETEVLGTATLATDAGVAGYIDGADPKAQNLTVTPTSAFSIQPGQTATFVLKADASAAKTAGTQGSVSLSLQLAGQSGVRDTRNSVTYSYTNSATTPVTFTSLTSINEYPVTVGNNTIN